MVKVRRPSIYSAIILSDRKREVEGVLFTEIYFSLCLDELFVAYLTIHDSLSL